MTLEIRGRAGERGLSLSELVITAALLSVVGAVILGGLAAFQGSTSNMTGRLENLAEARVAMAALTRDLRTAAPLTAGTSAFLTADDYEAKFYANRGSTTPSLVRLYIDTADARLIEEVTAPNTPLTSPPTYAATPDRVRVLATSVHNVTEGTPLFRYLDATLGELATPVAGTSLLAVQSVGIEVAVLQGTSKPVEPTRLVSSVRLPNAPLPTATP